MKVKFGINFVNPNARADQVPYRSGEPALEYIICLLTPLQEGKYLILSSSCLLHGKNRLNFERSQFMKNNHVMIQNGYFPAGKIREADIEGEEIKLEAHFVATENQPTIIEKGEQVKDNVSIPTNSEKHLCEDFAKLIVSSLHSDFEIRVQDSTFKGHKAIFAARSPVFAAMFEHPMEEASSGCVNIEDTDAATWQRFQDFVYSGRVSLEECSVEEHGSILGLADKYQVKTLFDHVAHNLKKIASVDNFFEVCDIASKFNVAEVELHLTKIYRRNSKHFTSEAVRSEIIERIKKNPNLVNIVWAEA